MYLETAVDDLAVIEEIWPAFEHVNVQAALDAWLALEGRKRQVIGSADYRHRGGFGLSDLLGEDPHRHGPRPGNVTRISLAPRLHRRGRLDAGALPGAVVDPDTGELISDAEVVETTYTAFASTKQPVTAWLVVRRVRDRAKLDELFPVWRYHPFFTNTDKPTAEADITHRRHAIIETVFADLIDGPLAHMPSGRFAANSAWAICAAMTHNLLRAAGTLSSPKHAVARGATLRRQIVTVPARLAQP